MRNKDCEIKSLTGYGEEVEARNPPQLMNRHGHPSGCGRSKTLKCKISSLTCSKRQGSGIGGRHTANARTSASRSHLSTLYLQLEKRANTEANACTDPLPSESSSFSFKIITSTQAKDAHIKLLIYCTGLALFLRAVHFPIRFGMWPCVNHLGGSGWKECIKKRYRVFLIREEHGRFVFSQSCNVCSVVPRWELRSREGTCS